MTEKYSIFEYEDASSAGDNMQAHFRFEKDKLYISIENPWCGDTESGFGATTCINLDKEAAKQLYDLIEKFIKEETGGVRRCPCGKLVSA